MDSIMFSDGLERQSSVHHRLPKCLKRAAERVLLPDLILAPHVLGEESVQRDCGGFCHAPILSSNPCAPGGPRNNLQKFQLQLQLSLNNPR